MSQWTWIEESVVWAVHEAQLAEHSGSAGVRDAGLLASALARPLNLAGYDSAADAAALAAAYAFGIARNHPFIDGNKRTGYVLMHVLLLDDGKTIQATEDQKYDLVIAVAEGRMDFGNIVSWLQEHAE